MLTIALLCLLQVQDAPLFTSKVSLVRVDAEVSDGTRTLDGLKKEDFRILDNGVMQPVVSFSQDQEPLDLILIFDTSGSMKPIVERVAAAAEQALGELRPGDRVAVWAFTRRSRALAPFTDDLKAVQRTLQVELMNERFRGGTNIQGAADDAAEFLSHEPRTTRRRAVLVFTDDYGVKTRQEKNVVEHYWEADAVLSELIIRSDSAIMRTATAIQMATPGGLMTHFLLNGTIQKIVDKTGGETLKANDASADFPQMMRRIRRRYSLYFALPEGKAGVRHELKVELTADASGRLPGAHVRASKGYVRPQ